MLFQQQLSYAQQRPLGLSNKRTKNIATHGQNILLDSLSLIPNTWQIASVTEDQLVIDPVKSTLSWLKSPAGDSIQIVYRVFPYRLTAVSRHFSFDSVRHHFILEKPYQVNYSNTKNTVFDFGKIDYSGSIGRGISFGNSQDAVVNSSMNLQITGYIGDSLELTAAVTDNNIPIQPDGNTQNLRDFDKIFLQIRKKGWQANFGDIDIRQTSNYFLNFYKRLQGASFITDNDIGKHTKNSLLVSGSVAKGKFNTNILTPKEGNQGPYRLQGASNELYFTILAGPERVFMDGELLQRGQDQDYVINYNTAELTFTPKRMVTKDKRIQVDFEYADQNYLNANIYLHDVMNFNNKFILSIGAFSNSDAKNSPINQTLDTKQKQFLADIGNGVDTAFYAAASLDTFGVGKIVYRKIDTLYNGAVHDSIYVLATGPSALLYNVGFTYMGPGKGNYVQLNNATNGKVFEWVAPVGNVKQGDYAPVILLIAPKKHQVITLGGIYHFKTNLRLEADVAVSKYDINLYSSKDKGDNDGTAARLKLVQDERAVRFLGKAMKLQANMGFEYVQGKFKPLERLRNVEFNRDWSLLNTVLPADEYLSTGGIKLYDAKGNTISYDVASYQRSDHFTGFRQVISHSQMINGWRVADQLSWTTTRSLLASTHYWRPSIDVSKLFKSLKDIRMGIGYSGESNIQRQLGVDTLTTGSFAFHIIQAYIKSNEAKLNRWGLTYFIRNDLNAFQNKMLVSSRSNNYSLTADLLKNVHQQFKFNITYRRLSIEQSSLTSQKPDESLLGRSEYMVNAWKGFLTGNLLYELGAGQEQKRTFSYVEVPAGQGEYAWNDYNHNGIAELNEFEVALYPDQKKYVRVNTPTNDYVKANYVQFNYSVDLTPRYIWKEEKVKGLRKLLAKSSTSSVLQINKKDIATGKFQFNPFTKKLVDTTLLTLSSFLSNSFYFNRLSTRWGFDISHSLNNTKSLLTYGFESRKLRTLVLKGRFSLKKGLIGNIVLRSIINQLNTPQFSNRNYFIRQQIAEPSISYVHGSNFRLTASYSYTDKQNTIDFHERALSNVWGANLKYNVLSSSTINAGFSLNSIQFSYLPGGDPNSTAGYVLLDGLLPGKNYLWNLEYTRRLPGNIELSIQYDGRKPGESKVVHTGRASIRALF